MSDAKTVVPLEKLDYKTHKDEILAATIDWFHYPHAKVFLYPKNYEVPLHTLSGNVLLVVLKGRVEFREENSEPEVAEAVSFRRCGQTPWIATVLEDSYILLIENSETEIIPK